MSNKILKKMNFGSEKIKGPKKFGSKMLVIIGTVIAEIFLIWTNVARANAAWTNVTVTDEICSR